MKSIELVLFIIAYSSIILTIFVSLICYRRNLENWETIAFSVSLLLLIVAITASSIGDVNKTEESTDIFILLAMVLVSLTTPLSVLVERKHSLLPLWEKILFAISFIIFCATGIAYFMNRLDYIEYVVAAFLGVSVISSMILLRTTKPKRNVAHLEKTNRIFAIAFIVVVPLSLLANYVFINMGYDLKVGFTLPLVFILLSVNKLFDDLQRLSLIKPAIDISEQHFKNYSLSKREQEVATLIAKGMTYKEIAEELFISIPTVKTHSSNIYKKCGVGNRHQLTVLLSN